jgi:hypothetical protein
MLLSDEQLVKVRAVLIAIDRFSLQFGVEAVRLPL